MTIRNRGAFGRLLGEVAVIVLGVLIALGADSWWDRLDDRSREMAHLESLRSDMTEAAEALESAISQDSAFTARVGARLDHLTSEATPGADAAGQTPDFNAADHTIPDGALQALVASDDLHLIQDAGLRAVLVQSAATLEANRAWIDEVMSQAGDNIREMTIAATDLQIRARSSGRTMTVDDLRGSAVIIGGTEVYIGQMANILSSLRNSQDAVAEILDAIDSELSDR